MASFKVKPHEGIRAAAGDEKDEDRFTFSLTH
jgi:hypothetical protein